MPQLSASEKIARSISIFPQKCLSTVKDVVEANTRIAMLKETILRNAAFIVDKITTFFIFLETEVYTFIGNSFNFWEFSGNSSQIYYFFKAGPFLESLIL